MEEEHETSSLRARRKKSSVSLGCCFNGHRRADSLDASSSSSSVPPSPSSSRRLSPSTWIRSKTNNDLPDAKIKGRYRGLMSCMLGHRRHSSADFSYDPLSYSLNFEDDDHDPSEVIREYFPMGSFAARLPLSPPSSAAGDGDQIIRMKQQPQMVIRTTPHPTIARSTSTTRAAAVAEVRKSLQQQQEEDLDERTPAGWTTRGPGLELPCTPINNIIIRKQQQVGEEIRKSRSPDHVGELMRRSIDIPHPPSTPRKVILTSTTSTTSTSTTTAMAASPTSRQVLVELF